MVLCQVEWTVPTTEWALWSRDLTWTLSATTATVCPWTTRTADLWFPEIRCSSNSTLTVVATFERYTTHHLLENINHIQHLLKQGERSVTIFGNTWGMSVLCTHLQVKCYPIFPLSSTLNSLRTAELCTPTLSVPTPPAPERSPGSLTSSWTWAVGWNRTQWPRSCTSSVIMKTAALKAQAYSTPPWLSTHPAASPIRCVCTGNAALNTYTPCWHFAYTLSGDWGAVPGDAQPELVCPSPAEELGQFPGPVSWHLCDFTITSWFPEQTLLPGPQRVRICTVFLCACFQNKIKQICVINTETSSEYNQTSLVESY